MGRGSIAALAVALLMTPGFGAATSGPDPNVFDGTPKETDPARKASLGNGDAAIVSDSDMAGPEAAATGYAATRAWRPEPPSPSAPEFDVPGLRGERGDPFAYRPVLPTSPIRAARNAGGETAELATMLMIGVGLISVGLFRRFAGAA